MRSVTLDWCTSLRSAAFPAPPVDVAACRITEKGGWGFPKRRNLTEEGGGKALIQRKVVILNLQPVEGGPTLFDFMKV